MRKPKIVVEGFEENKVSAIRTLRQATGCDLREAKYAVELENGETVWEVTDEVPLRENTYLKFRWEVADEVERKLAAVATLLLERRDYGSAAEVLTLIREICP